MKRVRRETVSFEACRVFGMSYARISGRLYRLIAISACVLLSSSAVPAAATPINLLANPGGEDGVLGSWTGGGALAFTVTSSTQSLSPGGSIQATAGSYWFYAVGPASANVSGYIQQEIDVRNYDFSSGLRTVQFGGDSFAISARSPVAASTNATYNIYFLDQVKATIGTAGNVTVMDQQTSPESTLGYRATATVPSSTKYIRFRAVALDGTLSATKYGFDQLYLSTDATLAPVPEPAASAIAMGSLLVFCGRLLSRSKGRPATLRNPGGSFRKDVVC